MPELEIIEHRKYGKGETVDIGGKQFTKCIFDGCIFTFSGGNYNFEDCTFVNIRAVGLYGCANNTITFVSFIREKVDPTYLDDRLLTKLPPSGLIH